MKGLIFVKNTVGTPIKAIIDLDLHGARWRSIYSEIIQDYKGQAEIQGIRHFRNENTVEMDLPLHEDILEDFYDGVLIDEQKNEGTIPWSEVKMKNR